MDHAMDDDDAASPAAPFVQQVSAAEFERQAVEYTTQEVERLNAAVREQPEIGARSAFFHHEENVVKGLPIFQGKHTRFVYDDEEEEIVAVLDVTQEALANEPVVRTAVEVDKDEDEDEEAEEDEDEEQEGDMVVDDPHVNALMMEDVEMEMAAVAIDEQKLTKAAALEH